MNLQQSSREKAETKMRSLSWPNCNSLLKRKLSFNICLKRLKKVYKMNKHNRKKQTREKIKNKKILAMLLKTASNI